MKPSKPNKNSLFPFMEYDEEEHSQLIHSTTNESKLDDYHTKHTIPDDSDPLSFWKDNESIYPNLTELAEKYL